MGFLRIAIPTAIMWFLNGVVVQPLALALTRRELKQAGTVPQNEEELSDIQKQAIESTFARNYMLTDAIVLGTAGFIGGLLGFFFIGVALRGRDWPGVIAFVIGSLIGFNMTKGSME